MNTHTSKPRPAPNYPEGYWLKSDFLFFVWWKFMFTIAVPLAPNLQQKVTSLRHRATIHYATPWRCDLLSPSQRLGGSCSLHHWIGTWSSPCIWLLTLVARWCWAGIGVCDVSSLWWCLIIQGHHVSVTKFWVMVSRLLTDIMLDRYIRIKERLD